MGKMATGLVRILDKALREKVVSMDAVRKIKERSAENLDEMPSIEQLIIKGHDPLHAVYQNTLNLISLFGEEMTVFPPLHQINDFIGKWLHIYQPSMPPMSPITLSFFTTWTLLDAAFGIEKETVGTCFVALRDRLQLDPSQAEVAKNLSQSRMGIYEVLQCEGAFCELRELVTGKSFNTLMVSGYKGSPGHIILIRLVPPLANVADYYVGMTTPYRLILQTRDDWLRYFERHAIEPGAVGVEARLHKHMKYGKNLTYWSEYIFYGYSNYQPGEVLLTGFPDQPQTQPAHKKYRQ